MFLEDQAQGLRKLVEEKQLSTTKPKIISISSGKGGVGKTNIAINLGIVFSMMGKKVIVMDGDLGLANVNVVLGIIPKYNIYHVVKGQKTLKEIIISTEYGIDIIAGASGFSQLTNLSEQERKKFIEELKELSYADIVIIDTSAGISSNVISFILASHEAIIVTTPEPTAITDAYGILKAISIEAMDYWPNIKLIVNMVRNKNEGQKIANRIVSIAGQFLSLKIESLGYILEDPLVEQAVRKQKPFVIEYPNSQASLYLKHIATRLEKAPIKEDQGGFSKLIKMFLGGR